MAGNNTSYARLLAMAGKRPAEGSSSVPPSIPQNPNNTPQAASKNPNPVADPGVQRTKARKKRAQADEFDRSKKLVAAGYEDPLEACADICHEASEKLKLFPGLKKERDEALAKVERTSELEKALGEAKRRIKSLDRSLRSSEEARKLSQEKSDKKIEELEGSVSKLKGEVEDLTLAKDSLEGMNEELAVYVRDLANDALAASNEQFNNALEQIQFCNPGLMIDRSVVHVSHIVLGDQIVKPLSGQGGTSLTICQ